MIDISPKKSPSTEMCHMAVGKQLHLTIDDEVESSSFFPRSGNRRVRCESAESSTAHQAAQMPVGDSGKQRHRSKKRNPLGGGSARADCRKLEAASPAP